jgi:hypothetical protein
MLLYPCAVVVNLSIYGKEVGESYIDILDAKSK